MAIHNLSAKRVETAKPGKYEDGGGLRLVVSVSGAKRWVLRYTVRGKRREMGLGSYPDIELAAARELANGYRAMAKFGKDPIEERKQERQVIPNFTQCAARYIRAHRRGWKNSKHAMQWVSTLKHYAVPVIGKRPVDEIETAEILKILAPVWTTKTETAKRVQGRVENVLDYAMARNYRTAPNPARWRGHLDMLLPKPSRIKRVRHHPAMPYQDVAGFMRELAQNGSVSAKALQLLILTATRTSEVLQATWQEIDLERETWIIPAERMKMNREHRIPLSPTAVKILQSLARFPGNDYLFPGAKRGRPLSNMALLQLMRGMGYGVDGDKGDYVPHGFRSSFRDWSGEVSSFPRDVAEMALAHSIANKVEAAYRRGDLFDKRRKMMEAWDSYISETSTNGQVLKMLRNGL